MKISSSSDNFEVYFDRIFDKYKDIILTIPELRWYYTYDCHWTLSFNTINNQQLCVNRINHQLFVNAVKESSHLDILGQMKYLNYSFWDYISFAISDEYCEFSKLHDVVDCWLPTKLVEAEEKIPEKIYHSQKKFRDFVYGIMFTSSVIFAWNAFYSPWKLEEEFKNFKNFEMTVVWMWNYLYKKWEFFSIENDMAKLLENEINSELNFRWCDFFPDDCSQLTSNVNIVEEREKITVAVTLHFWDYKSKHFSFQIPNKKAF